MNEITLAYAGVHQLFQLGLAAYEMGELHELSCSMIDLPGKLGSLLGRRLRVASTRPVGSERLPAEKIHEFPWPLVVHRLVQRLLPWRRSEHWHTSWWFDAHVARRLVWSPARIFVGGETCALQSFKVARKRRMRCVLDCSGIPSSFLDSFAARAGMEFGIPIPRTRNSRRMTARKHAEIALADVVLAASDLQKQALVSEGAPVEKIRVVPLWVDFGFWSAPARGPRPTREQQEPLRVLYAGTVSLYKGAPYLLRAVQNMRGSVVLTLGGRVSTEMHGMLSAARKQVRQLGRVDHQRLRALYQEQDVLVMPSLGDSFGFVTLEAMAAGLPVIASTNAGAPVPDAEWRIPACDTDALVQRLSYYQSNRTALAADGALARAFASRFTPERYRAQVTRVFEELLSPRAL